MTVLILDQFDHPSPYDLQQQPRRFEALVAEKLAETPRDRRYAARVADVTEDYRPEWCTTVFRANADGLAEVWKCRWDSSG